MEMVATTGDARKNVVSLFWSHALAGSECLRCVERLGVIECMQNEVVHKVRELCTHKGYIGAA